jgi:hypothetical protein
MKAGKRWRILANEDRGDRRVELHSPEYVAESKKAARKQKVPTDYYDGKPVAPFSTVFDELVIDDWFHLEQMDDNQWWMRIGDAMVNVRVKDGKAAEVLIERGQYD